MMKNYKKIALLLTLVVLFTMITGCGKSTSPAAAGETETETENTSAPEAATGTYTLYNVTGEKLTELYLYETGSDKGENRIPDGLRNHAKMVLTYDGTTDTTLTLEYTTESGAVSKFETLHIEEAPIAMQSVDATSGATPISFSVPEDTGNYTIVNTTGTTVTELYIYPNDGDKGENLAGEGMEDGESVEFSYTGAVDTSLTVEFTTEADGTKSFETLHIETVTINLLSVDAMSGATPIQFGF